MHGAETQVDYGKGEEQASRSQGGRPLAVMEPEEEACDAAQRQRAPKEPTGLRQANKPHGEHADHNE